MSEPSTRRSAARDSTAPRKAVGGRLTRRRVRAAGGLAAGVLLLALPFYLERFWLLAGLLAMAAAIGAIGLNLLTGAAGQLSLGHAFFLAVGAYGYCALAGAPDGDADLVGLGLPPWLAVLGAVALAGLTGGAFSPIAGRLRGAYLGIATLALIFVGQHLLFNIPSVTGGYHGRAVPELTLAGAAFDDEPWVVAGVPFQSAEKLWYLGLALLLAGALFARNVLRGRPGRALNALRDHRIAAGVLGVPVARYRAAAFALSAMYAGLAGVLLALVFQQTVPEYFGFALSLEYLAMIVIGGLGTVAGAVAGAAFVVLLPQLFTRYGDALPLVSEPGAGGLTPGELSRYVYGAAVVTVVLFLPGGLARLTVRRRPAGRRHPRPAGRTR